MLNILPFSYSEMLSITAHCSMEINIKSIFFILTNVSFSSVSSLFSFPSLLSSLSPAPLLVLGGSAIGMATGRVQAGFLHTRTRPAGLGPNPTRLLNRFFSRGPNPLPLPPSPTGPIKPKQKGSFFETSPKLNIKPIANNQSQKSLLFKSPQSHLNKKSHFSILKPRNNQTNGGDFGSNKI